MVELLPFRLSIHRFFKLFDCLEVIERLYMAVDQQMVEYQMCPSGRWISLGRDIGVFSHLFAIFLINGLASVVVFEAPPN